MNQSWPSGRFIDVEASDTLEQIRKLKSLAVENQMFIVPGHDPTVWPTIEDVLPRVLK